VKFNHPALVVSPSRSSLLVWMLLCFIVALVLAALLIKPALAQKQASASKRESRFEKSVPVFRR